MRRRFHWFLTVDFARYAVTGLVMLAGAVLALTGILDEAWLRALGGAALILWCCPRGGWE